MTCAFCAIVESGDKVIWSDRYWSAFPDAHPRAGTHILIVPNAHVVSLDRLTSGESRQLPYAIAQVVLTHGLGGQYKVELNGPSYMRVKHLHLHILGPKRT